MAALSGIEKLKAVAADFESPGEFFDFLSKSGVGDCESLALMATSEVDVKADIIDVAKAGSVKLELKATVGTKKLWLASRKIMDALSLSKQVQDETKASTGLPVDIEIDLKKKWVKLHGFSPPVAWLVNEELQKKIWTADDGEEDG